MFKHELVNPPKLVQTNVDGKRLYLDENGKAYESVTSYIGRVLDKPGLHKWRARVGAAKADEIANAAARRGSNLHNVLESYLRNNLSENAKIKNDPSTKSLFLKVKPCVDRLNSIRLIETSLYSSELGLAGTPDTIAEYSGKLAVVDFKTSTRLKKKKDIVNYFIQCAAYGIMFNEHFGEMPKLSVIIMAIPDLHHGMVYIHPMEECVSMLQNLMKDPVLFNARIAESS